VGLIVNPFAGVGGSVALKGSDGTELRSLAAKRGATAKAEQRTLEFLRALLAQSGFVPANIRWQAIAGPMGGHCLTEADLSFAPVEYVPADPCTAVDTENAARELLDRDIDLLIFVGGDGTARNVLSAVGNRLPVLGIPAGVKMHSGVFAITPRTAAVLLAQLVSGGLVAPVHRQVRDYDDASASNEIMLRSYGELCVPEIGGYIQQTKVGGKESEPLAVQEICAEIIEHLPHARDIVLGPGSTCSAIKQAMGVQGTLRGFDVVRADGGIHLDLTAADLEALSAPYVVISFTRAQGFLFGRGNQQLSAQFLSQLSWPEDVRIVGTRTKLASLERRPLLLDTGDARVDDQLSGLVDIVCGFEDRLLYRLATIAAEV